MKNKMKGFTIIELVLAIVIISVGLFGMMALFNNVTRGVMEGDMNIIATFLGREKLEQLVADKVYRGYAYIINSNYTTNENLTVGSYNFNRQFSIYEVSKTDLITALAGSGFKRIDMTIKWGEDANQRITMPTVLASY